MIFRRTPLEADYDISKTLFEDLVTIFEDYFKGSDEAQTPFKDPGQEISKVWGFLKRYKTSKVYGFWTKISKVYSFL
ncbi:hypothetical protein RCL_jg12874.t1 [Rhizophagus clarus]|uniref:Uncharacterized protein n=1 Tax=Rhizophagus clarus TaxID=94130 RepID=A0A8H3KXW3_9GLOM|nr:hypothetical protein RCL_jg12874.t1 [Rhizophagus clarus]